MDDLTPIRPPSLQTYTPARVALRRTGNSLATSEILAFQQAHAQARDAVHATLNPEALVQIIHTTFNLESIVLNSAAPNRSTYLRRPDLGRTLSPASAALLNFNAEAVIVLADGLSALAPERHAIPLLHELLPLLADWQLSPICIVQQARVAIADPIGALTHASLSIVLIGERPGLSSPDSLGAYITWQPRPGRTDAERNCISNIRTAGLNYASAAQKIAHYANEARRLRLSGTTLKELDISGLPSLT
jgi:ethanolamine ammonia-lyase small subunit